MFAILGLSKTGFSVAKFLEKQGKDFYFIDSKATSIPKNLKNQFANREFILGKPKFKSQTNIIVASPGIDLRFITTDIPVISDIELFLHYRNINKPIIAVTGTNGKSSVVAMIEHIIKKSGLETIASGNFGYPILDTLTRNLDIYLLELSSFQLDITKSLHNHIAVITNITEDHLDRYASKQDYINSKLKILNNCKISIVEENIPLLPQINKKLNFITVGNNLTADFYLLKNHIFKIKNKLCNTKDFQNLELKHDFINAMFAFATTEQLIDNITKNIKLLFNYQPLNHRNSLIKKADFYFINDSKATNVSAFISTFKGLSAKKFNHIHLLIGGISKEQNLKPMAEVIMNQSKVKTIILFGQDKFKFQKIFKNTKVKLELTDNMESGFKKIINNNLNKNDLIALIPAAASFDQFSDYQARGDFFLKLIKDYEF